MRILLSVGIFAVTFIGLITMVTEKDANDLVRKQLNVEKRDTTKIYNLTAYKRNSKTPVEVDTSRYCIAYWTYPNRRARVSIFKDTKHPIFYYNFVSSEPSTGNTNSSNVRLQYKYLKRHRCSGKNVLRYEFPPAGVVLPKIEKPTQTAASKTAKKKDVYDPVIRLKKEQYIFVANKLNALGFKTAHHRDSQQGYKRGVKAWQLANGYTGSLADGRLRKSQAVKLNAQPTASPGSNTQKKQSSNTSAISGKYNISYWQSVANNNKSQKSIFFKKHEWERLQSHLSSLGYPNTFYVGIRAWQRKNGYKGNGRVTSAQLMKLVRQKSVGNPNKARSTQTKSNLPKQKLNLTRDQWKQVQRRLTQIGFSTGGADGIVGPKTVEAIKRFQKHRRWPVNGVLNSYELKKLFK